MVSVVGATQSFAYDPVSLGNAGGAGGLCYLPYLILSLDWSRFTLAYGACGAVECERNPPQNSTFNLRGVRQKGAWIDL